MEDQFGGRTDDDLFFDDFEPVSESQPIETVETVAPPPPPAAVATPPVEPPKPEPAPQKPVEQHQPPPAQPVPTAPRGGLANSRFNPNKPAAAPRPPRQTAPAPTTSAPTTTVNNNNNNNNNTATTPTTTPAPPQAPTGPAAQTSSAAPSPHTNKSNSPAPPHHRGEKQQHAPATGPGANTALNAEARMSSGANPRTKLTEAELAAKMEQMRILNAEKTRKFEQAEQDERSHAEAYARGMEEARKRKQADEERRRRGEEERRRMDDERARNRERKLKAMSMKEGGWDEGKDALAAEEERRGFRGANGGIRGTRSGAGLAGSRFATQEAKPEGDRYSGEERRGGRGRGRGRGQGRGGRGGRGGYGNDFEREPASNGNREPKKPAPEPKAPAINTEEFPALPGKAKTGEATTPVLSPLTGAWDDEMEAFDAKMKSEAQS